MKRLFLVLFMLMFSVLSANADELKNNILNSIQIDSLNDTYNITLDTKYVTDFKRTTQSADNMILTIKNIKPSKSLNTIYKNAAEVDSITVEPVNENTLNIAIKAKNISNSAVSVSAQEAVNMVNGSSVIAQSKRKLKKKKHESIVLSAPIDAYMPVYKDEEILDDELMPASSINFAGLIAKIKNILSEGNVSNIITTGLIGIILFCGIKLFKKEEQETAIGLVHSLKDREKDLYGDMSKVRSTIGAMTQDVAPQLMPKQPENIMPQNIRANAGYGMRAYQASTKSPYMSSDMMLKRSMPKAQNPIPNAMSTVGSRVNNSQQMQMNTAKPAPNFSQSPLTASNIDSMKFLESMTKIYEKNGRTDLAQGIKAGMLKAKNM